MKSLFYEMQVQYSKMLFRSDIKIKIVDMVLNYFVFMCSG